LNEGLLRGEERKSAFKINNLFGMLKAVENGIGIAGLPDYMVQGVVNINKVLPELRGPSTDVYFVYSFELKNSKRLNVFRDFLMRKMAEDGLNRVA
jgi:DNA-binding transcriptional LysR family regulator